ncbi:hypothetical protein Ocin01_06896 [Orchesella cincta]|uniref:Uncharacterized protein n=1 Tax=Orchesella cincta TaxID=48709 RepID=A0A1D2N3F0_ORCCI|nr:hypothetical protein Ocin01_06896 [Orchesella cincta]
MYQLFESISSEDSDDSDDKEFDDSDFITTPKFQIASSAKQESYFSITDNLLKDKERNHALYEYNSTEISIQLNGLVMNQDQLIYTFLTKLFKFGKLWDYPEIVFKISGLKLLARLFANEAPLMITVFAEIRGWGEKLMNWKTKPLKVSSLGTAQTKLRIKNEQLTKFREKFPSMPNIIVTIEASWKFSPTAPLKEYFATLAKQLMSDEVRHLEGTVIVNTSDGKRVKFPKGILAASSSVLKKQFKNSLVIKVEEGCPQEDCMEIEMHGDGAQETILRSSTVKALMEFLTCFSVREAMKNSNIAVELLMTGVFYEIQELEIAMKKILLAQPTEWFDTEGLVNLYWYAGQIKEVIQDDKNKRFDDWRPWEILQIKALWNLKGIPREELTECKLVKKLFPTKASLHTLIHFISHV